MERINAKDVQSMMEAYASIYNNQEQEIISEETQELEEQQYGGAMGGIKGPLHYLDTLLQGRQKADEIARKRGVLPKTGGGSGSGSGSGSGGGSSNTAPAGAFNISPKGSAKRAELEAQIKRDNAARSGGGSSNTAPAGAFNISPKGSAKRAELEAQIKRDNAARTDDQRVQPKPQPKPQPKSSPSSNLKTGSPNVTKDGTKFERRTPTMAELRAAQAARRAAPKVLSRAEIENRALKAAVNAGKVTQGRPDAKIDPASVQAALKKVNSSGAAPTGAAPRPRPRPTGARPMGARNRGVYREELDVFDTIKEYLIGEGATEEEALKQMTILTDEQRTEILEGIIGQTADNIARTAGTVVGTAQRVGRELPAYLKQKVSNVKGTFDRARERADENIPPNAVKNTKKPSQLKNSYEAVGELVDEGSCGSKKKKKSKKGGY